MKEKIEVSSKCLDRDEIIKYKNNVLSADELRRIESHIIDCPLCSLALEEAEKFDSNELEEIFEKTKIKIGGKKKSSWKIIISSVAAVLILALTAITNLNNSSVDKDIFSEYFEVYPDITLHTRSNSSPDQLTIAMDEYNLGNFKKAKSVLNSLATEGKNDTIIFYLAISNLELNQFEKSIELLNHITTNTNSGFFLEASWYSALANIYLENYEEAKKELSILSVSNSKDYKTKATKVLSELKEIE